MCAEIFKIGDFEVMINNDGKTLHIQSKILGSVMAVLSTETLKRIANELSVKYNLNDVTEVVAEYGNISFSDAIDGFSIYFPNIEKFRAEDACHIHLGKNCLAFLRKLKNVEINSTVEGIESKAFTGTNVKTININSPCIHEFCFTSISDCPSLKTVNIPKNIAQITLDTNFDTAICPLSTEIHFEGTLNEFKDKLIYKDNSLSLYAKNVSEMKSWGSLRLFTSEGSFMKPISELYEALGNRIVNRMLICDEDLKKVGMRIDNYILVHDLLPNEKIYTFDLSWIENMNYRTIKEIYDSMKEKYSTEMSDDGRHVSTKYGGIELVDIEQVAKYTFVTRTLDDFLKGKLISIKNDEIVKEEPERD